MFLSSKLSDCQSLQSQSMQMSAYVDAKDSTPPAQVTVEAYERRITRLENEKTELQRKLTEASRVVQQQFHGNANGVIPNDPTISDSEFSRLKDEINILKKKLSGKRAWGKLQSEFLFEMKNAPSD